MKILITGAAGFIGSHLCDVLVKDYKVVGIDNLSLGKRENVKHLLTNKNFFFHQCDILDPKEFENIFRVHSIDAIFHLAANSDISNPDPKKDFQNTLSTTLVVLEKCRIRGIKQLVFTSSGSVYGDIRKPAKENYGPLLPISAYAASKLSSEAFISFYSDYYGIQSWILRLPNVIGPRLTHGAVLDFMNKLKMNPGILRVLGNGTQKKSYMYVSDFVEAMLFIWQNSKNQVNIFNLMGNGQTSVKEIAEMTAEKFGKHTEIIYGESDRGWKGDVPYYDCDISKLKKLGWSTQMTSNGAILKTLQYYETGIR